eukprot:TRINITY_DN2217_c0_g1_i3.p1 TRINITY_DN2217_c0_g1~~TRINITY_DN2217_c0_g1_i3.p1  ORF type:complete len:1471 (+),score=363.32 TRINITY_DN2217_c0_g1_i3:184-4596(+)
MEPYYIVLGEINHVVSSMKLNVRWSTPNPIRVSSPTAAQNSAEGSSPLLNAFKNLQQKIHSHRNIDTLDTCVYLKPFLNVIRSEETSGPITGVALSSVNKFLCTFITERSNNVAKAIEGIADAVTHCRFEATDPESDEVVLMKILEVLLSCVKSPIAVLLTEDLVLEMIQTAFRMSSQTRLSELLRKTAERTLTEMAHALFVRLKNPNLLRDDTSETESGYTTPRSPQVPPNSESPSAAPSATTNPASSVLGTSPKAEGVIVNPQGVRFEMIDTAANSGRPFGVHSLLKVLQFVCGIVRLPSGESAERTEDICLLGLNLANTILETCGQNVVKYPQILKLIKENLCKQLSKCLSTDDLLILSAALRVLSNLFIYLGEHLKLQIELFFTTITRIMENKTTSYTHQETILEAVVDFCKEPFFMTSLYVNYDCDNGCSNVFENLCKFLYKNAFPVSGSLYTTHVLSLDGLLAIVQSISGRLGPDPTYPLVQVAHPSYPTPDELRLKKLQKTNLMTGVEAFNRDVQEGIKFLTAAHIVTDPPTPESLASFLRFGLGVNKTVIGEYIGKNKEFNIKTLEAYVQTFEFAKHRRFVDALREFMESFRIVGESQVIQRIVEIFAREYCAAVTDIFANVDACEVLSYSIVMLNVDQHNPKASKTKMTEKDYVRTLRGVNDKKDFPQEMLVDIYHDIKNNEIRLAEEYSGIDVNDTMWRQLISKSATATPFVNVNSSMYDQEIFSVIWGALVASISVVFDTAYDELVLQKTVDGFNLCARISAHYHLSHVLDNLVLSLCKFSMLLSLSGSQAASHFGHNKKAQLATQTVFDIARLYGDEMQEGWKNVLNCIITMQKLDILPKLFEPIQPFDVPDPVVMSPQPKSSGWLSGWFGGASAAIEVPEEPQEQDVEAIQAAKESVKLCGVEEIVTNMRNVRETSIINLVRALIAGSSKPQKVSPHFEHKTAIFCLDFLTSIAIMNEHRIALLWASIAEHLVASVEPPVTSVQLAEKSVINTIHLCIRLFHKEEISESLLACLKNLLHLEPKLGESMCKQITVGVSRLIVAHPGVIQSAEGSEIIFAFVDFANRFPASANFSFQILRSTIVDGSSYINSTNFPRWITSVQQFLHPKNPAPITIQAMELLYVAFLRANTTLAAEIGDSQETQNRDAWTSFLLPILQQYCALSKDSRLDVRNYAMTYLQRSLLSPHMNSLSPVLLYDCFQQILFPLLSDLLKSPKELAIDANGLEETRLRASAILTKIFLQYLPNLTRLSNFNELWINILQSLKHYMQTNSELLAEAVQESLKNVLLVMSASDVFQPSNNALNGSHSLEGTGGAEDLWQLSWNTINSFCPSLRGEFDHVLNTSEAPKVELSASGTLHVMLPTAGDISTSSPAVLPLMEPILSASPVISHANTGLDESSSDLQQNPLETISTFAVTTPEGSASFDQPIMSDVPSELNAETAPPSELGDGADWNGSEGIV